MLWNFTTFLLYDAKLPAIGHEPITSPLSHHM